MRSFIWCVCGSVGTTIDYEDVELNPEGVICCSNCRSILACREAWYAMYGNPYKTDISDLS